MKPDSKQNQQRGLTLVELLIVLAILVGLGGLLSVTLSSGAKVVGRDGVERTDEEVATTATMQTVRDALIGASPTEPGYRQDLGDLPSRLGALIENIDSEDVYDPARKRGWRGPYVFDLGTRFSADFNIGAGFPALVNGDPLIPDAWGNPLILGEGTHPSDPSTTHTWLVSAGENRTLETDLTDADHDTNNDGTPDRGDDLVIFLLTADPNL